MRIITCNLNGIRSAAKKGFFAWMLKQNADVICVQEIKIHTEEVDKLVFHPEGYHSFFSCADKKGYSGVGIYTKQKPKEIVKGLGWPEADQEGRYIAADFGNVVVASLYMPSGTSGDHRQAVKYDFLKRYADYLTELRKTSPELILCGDWNIAHTKLDIKNWRGNQKNSGFLPEERAWMDNLFGPLGFYDAFRLINQDPDQYTWWSNRGQARAKNVGWRIDYQVVTPGLKNAVQSVSIYKEERFSDHAPLMIDYIINN